MAVEENQQSYLEKLIDAKITYKDNNIQFIFQRAKLNMEHVLEIEFLKRIHPQLNTEFKMTDDQLIISHHPPKSYKKFNEIFDKDISERWQFAYNIIQAVRAHQLDRAKLTLSPENIVFDQGLVPQFLHYGVSESLHPYESDDKRLWLKKKAIIALIADNTNDFTTYLAHYETKELPETPATIMRAESYEDVIEVIEKKIKEEEAYEATVVRVPEKKWRFRRYITWVLTVILIPSLAYGAYALFFKIPEINSYVESHRYFYQEEYSSVIDTLHKSNHEKMPRIVQYELASSYIVNESLTEEQRKNIQGNITLQSNKRYFLYWIDIGRGNYQEAIDTARVLEDRDLIVFSLLKQREYVKTDQSL